jgi:hypothetical protein
VLDDVAINILAITAKHSLFLTSCSRTTLGESYDALSLLVERGYTGLPRSASQTKWVRFFLSAGNRVIRETGTMTLYSLIALPFG